MARYHKWTQEMVAKQLEQAVITMHKLPPVNTKGYVSCWPEIVRPPHEVACTEPNPIRLPPTPDMIAKMEQAFGWMKWLTVDERKLVWRRAERVCWKRITRELGYNRMTGLRKWQWALRKIVLHLNLKKPNLLIQ